MPQKTTNWVDGFRLNDAYEDVFIEDDHYLYVCAEPFNWAHMLSANPYIKQGEGKFIREDTVGVDTAYLDKLVKAPLNVAHAIARLEEIRNCELLSDLENMDS